MFPSAKKIYVSFLKLLLPLTLLLGVLQYMVVHYLSGPIEFLLSTWSIYLFHLSVTLVIMAALVAVAKVAYDKTGFAFMACSLLKMFASVVFLIPLIKSDQASKIPDALAFFVPYFIYLVLDIYFTLRLLNQKKS